ncbi:hypothetical protein IU510_25820 [Nocardia cyriacigeorgica]|uniref:hypothetical protein n=1 Tax=Nocardia cyriacigeorgica TaxID=135487 RepID=UPI0018957C98|nr:hypothetical protein [Nocardia cyriacigeorgica]MBF6101444.1 hypothetical protein [Nocardia cyriacigeorgica]MBF6162162.1 hypothetical protein [Nocardia cyriacigeorgica]MBF6200776.1 hypothetical protein [Nocardia cyriacigeorgica]
MAEQVDQLQHWQNLKTQAENGELRLEPELGNALMGRCDTMLTELDAMRTQALNLQYVAGFGTLPSAQALAKKFAGKAFGDEDSAVKRIEQSIDIVNTMRQTFELSIRTLTETDQAVGQNLGNAANQ